MGGHCDAQLRTDKQVTQSHQCTICLEFGSHVIAPADAASVPSRELDLSQMM